MTIFKRPRLVSFCIILPLSDKDAKFKRFHFIYRNTGEPEKNQIHFGLMDLLKGVHASVLHILFKGRRCYFLPLPFLADPFLAMAAARLALG